MTKKANKIWGKKYKELRSKGYSKPFSKFFASSQTKIIPKGGKQ